MDATMPPALSLHLPRTSVVPRMGLETRGKPLPPVVTGSGRVRVVQYRDGVELVLDPGRVEPGPASALLGALAAIGAALTLSGQLWAVALAAVGLGGLAWQAARPPMLRRLLAHGASETWLLAGQEAAKVMAGGASSDLVLALDLAARGCVRLRLFTSTGEQDLGPAAILSPEELAPVRRFLALSGVRAVGTALVG